jgi:hypothetical protein
LKRLRSAFIAILGVAICAVVTQRALPTVAAAPTPSTAAQLELLTAIDVAVARSGVEAVQAWAHGVQIMLRWPSGGVLVASDVLTVVVELGYRSLADFHALNGQRMCLYVDFVMLRCDDMASWPRNTYVGNLQAGEHEVSLCIALPGEESCRVHSPWLGEAVEWRSFRVLEARAFELATSAFSPPQVSRCRGGRHRVVSLQLVATPARS